MKIQKFDDLVKARSEQLFQERVQTFKADVEKALGKLFGGKLQFHNLFYYNTDLNDDNAGERGKLAVEIFKILSSENNRSGWPIKIRECATEEVFTSLINTLDSVQRAMIAAGEVKMTDPVNTDEEEI